MKNLKTKIILASLISTFGMFGISSAASLYLDVTPATLVKNVGNSFNVSVNVNTDGANVYAVEGTVVLDNLTCKAVTLSDGLVAQSLPTCSNPYFLIGIPKGTSVNKTLFKILVDGASAGIASISITNVDIMGAGRSLSNVSVGGQYQISAPKPLPLPLPSAVSATTSTSTVVVATSSREIASSSEIVLATVNPENKGNGLVATVLDGLYNLPKMLFTLTPLSIIVLLLLGFIFYKIPRDGIVE